MAFRPSLAVAPCRSRARQMLAISGLTAACLLSWWVTSNASIWRSRSLVFIGFTSSDSAPSLFQSLPRFGYAVRMAVAGL